MLAEASADDDSELNDWTCSQASEGDVKDALLSIGAVMGRSEAERVQELVGKHILTIVISYLVLHAPHCTVHPSIISRRKQILVLTFFQSREKNEWW